MADNNDWVLSFECLDCGYRNFETRSTYEGLAQFFRDEMGEGRKTGKGEYECNTCKGDKFIQWMTPAGCLRVTEDEVLSRG